MRRFMLSIVNWEDHQDRPDRLNYSWFKCHAKTINGHFWSATTSDQFKVWFCLLCLRNGQTGEILHTNDLTLAGYCNLEPKEISGIIDKLIEIKALRDETRAETAPTRATRPKTVEESRVEESIYFANPIWLAKAWNENCGTLPKIKHPEKLDAKRRKSFLEAIRDRPEKELWIEAIKKMAASDFCLGKKNSKEHPNWKAKVDFLTRLGNLDRVLEGEFDNTGHQPQKSLAAELFDKRAGEGVKNKNNTPLVGGTEVKQASECADEMQKK